MERVIAILDIGKTNKKLLLFNEQYRLVHELAETLPETVDEDGDTCEDLALLQNWVVQRINYLQQQARFEVAAINVTTYGASLVYINDKHEPLTPLYNYLKPYPAHLEHNFFNTYGPANTLCSQTASPALASLNAGLQLYRLKHQQPDVLAQVKYALHLPQYVAMLIHGHAAADITSIGCHTLFWHFEQNQYHAWVHAELLTQYMAPIQPGHAFALATVGGKRIPAGFGLHDSSAALIPYLASMEQPFALLSTGTWCITLNPFNSYPLTEQQLAQDCLCYLSWQGTSVKASRLFAGFEHQQQCKRIAAFYGIDEQILYTVAYNDNWPLEAGQPENGKGVSGAYKWAPASAFAERSLSSFVNAEHAYHQLIFDLVITQVASSLLVLQHTAVENLYVDGGFSHNEIYMQMLANALPGYKVYAANVAQATALGAALALHQHWNKSSIPLQLITTTLYNPKEKLPAINC